MDSGFVSPQLLCSSWHGNTVLSDTQFLIHGGYDGSSALHDTFVFDIGDWFLELNPSCFPKLKKKKSNCELNESSPSPSSDTNTWTEVKIPQLSVPRAGHSIITMETPVPRRFAVAEEDDGDSSVSVSVGRTLLVFGGGDNEGSFYSDLATVSVEEILARV